jgi:alpha-beta hydrolase superfamily lysophospholipase
MPETEPQFMTVDGAEIAIRKTPGASPAVVWLGGFRSDMLATKATHLSDWGRAHGRAVVRFDYSGHGESGAGFEEGTIGRWSAEARAVIEAEAGPAPILVGSSMGGWIALLAAKALAEAGRPVGGLVLIAPAVDFTEALMWDQFPESVRQEILDKGHWMRPTQYAPEPYPITRALIEDGRRHLLFNAPLKVGAPVRILQGMQDPDVPWTHAMTLVEHLAEDDVTVTLIKDGDHRLSRPEDLERLIEAVETVAPVS